MDWTVLRARDEQKEGAEGARIASNPRGLKGDPVDGDHRKAEDAGWAWQLMMSFLRVTVRFKPAIPDREEMSNVT
jgi:hypothetical protein